MSVDAMGPCCAWADFCSGVAWGLWPRCGEAACASRCVVLSGGLFAGVCEWHATPTAADCKGTGKFTGKFTGIRAPAHKRRGSSTNKIQMGHLRIFV